MNASWARLALPTLAALAAITPAASQEISGVEYVPYGQQFHFAPPGARSLAMGSTFIGLADDATASESNPAGLTVLSKPEFSAQLRVVRPETEIRPTICCNQVGSILARATFTSLSFASFVYPRGRVALSAYYQRPVDFGYQASFEGRKTFPGAAFDVRDHLRTRLTEDTVGLALAVRLASWASLGMSVRGSRLRLEDSAERQAVRVPGLSSLASADGDDQDVTVNAGAMFRPSSRVSLGLVFKQAREYSIPAALQAGRASARTDVGSRIPAVLGAGLAVRATEKWTLQVDLVEVDYDPSPGFAVFRFGLRPSPESEAAQFVVGASPEPGFPQLAGRARSDADATEVHFGSEWVLGPARRLLALRLGVFTDPDHDSASFDSDQVHVSAGAGLALRQRFQIDLAVDFGKRIRQGITSVVYRF